jgi:hypothetical protein
MSHVVALVVLLSAAPVPKGKPEPAYLPTAVGAEAVYRYRCVVVPPAGGPPGARPPAVADSTVTVVVTAVEQKGGETLVTLAETLDGKDQGSDTFVVSGKGVFNVKTISPGPPEQSWKHDPPICLLSLPHKPGQKWTCDNPAQPGGLVAVKATKTAHGPEEVEVPAGKYTAIRVEHRGKAGDATFWYAPGVGLVKMVSKDVVQELESFTPRKK